MKPVGNGQNDLWTWFGLGRASFLTLPRLLMHEMPDEWQGKMAALLNEYEEAFPNQDELPNVCVVGTRECRECLGEGDVSDEDGSPLGNCPSCSGMGYTLMSPYGGKGPLGIPRWLTDYRYPSKAKVDELRGLNYHPSDDSPQSSKVE